MQHAIADRSKEIVAEYEKTAKILEDHFADKEFTNIDEFESLITRELIDRYIESSREHMKKNEFKNNILYVVC
mgnify:CR=1 FL=1